MAKHNLLGKKGEEIAIRYLKGAGYKILALTWRFGKQEIDIVSEIDNTLIIVEVKTRTDDYFGSPESFVTKGKQKHLIKAANAYIEKHDIQVETRFDVIAILLKGEKYELEHFKDAFYPVA